MRLFESISLVLAGVVLVATVLRGPTWRPVAAGGAVALAVALVLHGAVEGTRWQLVTLYLLAVVLVLAGGVRLLRPERRRTGWRRVTGVLLALVGGAAIVLAGVLGWVLPVPRLPGPEEVAGGIEEGLAPVGTAVWVMGTDRVEPYGEEAGDSSRRLPVQAWYPMPDGAREDPAPWVQDAPRFGREATAWLGLPPFLLNHLDLVDTHATLDGPVADGPLPLVVYSHGWGGFRSVQSGLAEHLAARGFVVVAPDHVHGAVASRFPGADGEPDLVVGIDATALPEEEDVGADAYAVASARLVDTYASDLVDLLGDLRATDGAAPSALTSAVDASRVLLLGHSTGGGAAVVACNRLADAEGDLPSCVGVLAYDPWVEPAIALGEAEPLDVPFHAVRSEAWVGNDNDGVLGPLLAAGGEGSAVSLPDTGHRDVTLFGFLSPLAGELGLTGDADVGEVHRAIDRETLAFADRLLRGRDVELPSADGDPAFRDDGLLARG